MKCDQWRCTYSCAFEGNCRQRSNAPSKEAGCGARPDNSHPKHYRYDDLKISHTRWEGFCVKCFDIQPHATLYGRRVCQRCMACGHDELIRTLR